jgi:hypothetical protein
VGASGSFIQPPNTGDAGLAASQGGPSLWLPAGVSSLGLLGLGVVLGLRRKAGA